MLKYTSTGESVRRRFRSITKFFVILVLAVSLPSCIDLKHNTNFSPSGRTIWGIQSVLTERKIDNMLHLLMLTKAVSENRTIILTQVEGLKQIEMLDNWLCSVMKLKPKVSNFIILTSLEHIKEIYESQGYNVFLMTSNVSKNVREEHADFLSHNFENRVCQRRKIAIFLLEHGYRVLIADNDAVWLKNPFIHGDFDGSADIYAQDDGGSMCVGFIIMKSSVATIRWIRAWHQVHSAMVEAGDSIPGQPLWDEQRVANKILTSKRLHPQLARLLKDQAFAQDPKVKPVVKLLDRTKFPPGKDYFNPGKTGKDRAVIVHNNFISGFQAKKERFIKFGLWSIRESKCL